MADRDTGPADLDDAVVEVLHDSARLGFLGPGAVEPGLVHAAGFVAHLRPAARVLDLGAGGGLPGLVVAALLPEVVVVLLDASVTRTDFLRRAVGRLGWAGRVEVVTARAEQAGRDDRFRGTFDAVVSRGFGPPAATAEAAAPLLRQGGQLLVSEPPAPLASRWPPSGLELLGLRRDELRTTAYASCTLVAPCPDRFPRRRLTPLLF